MNASINNEANEFRQPSRDPESSPASDTARAAMQVESPSSLLALANTDSAESTLASLSDLAIPAVLNVTFYVNIPRAVDLHRGLLVYQLLIVSAGLAVFLSVCNIIYTLVMSVTIGGASKNVRKKVMVVALAFLAVALVLRGVLLLL